MHPWLADRPLRRAFRRVKENHGCAGADSVDLAAFEASLDARLDDLRGAVESGDYWAWPLRRIEVEKHPGSEERRGLLVPAVQDRVLQTAVAAYMEPFLEKEFDDCSFAYRRGRSVRMAVERVYRYYNQGYLWLVDADIDDFFGSVDERSGPGAPLHPDPRRDRPAPGPPLAGLRGVGRPAPHPAEPGPSARFGDFAHAGQPLPGRTRRPPARRGHPTGAIRRRFRDPHEEPQGRRARLRPDRRDAGLPAPAVQRRARRGWSASRKASASWG